MSETKNKEYEMAYLLSPEIAEDKVETEAAELAEIISSGGGAIADSLPVAKRPLAYPIKKNKQAYFGVVFFKIAEESLDALKKTLSLNKKYLRFLILNGPIKPKPVAAPKSPIETPAPTQSFDQKLESILNR